MVNVRHLSLWYSFLHAVTVLILIPLAVGVPLWAVYNDFSAADGDAAKSSVQHGNIVQRLAGLLWAFKERLAVMAPTPLMTFVAGFSGFYYAVDLVIMLLNVHPLTWTLKGWYTVHHIFCFAGLMAPGFWSPSALDCVLSQAGFWFGEISNPPRCVVDLLQYQIDKQRGQYAAVLRTSVEEVVASKSGPGGVVLPFLGRCGIPQLKSLMATLQTVHLVMFIAFRFVGAYYVACVVYPYAQLRCTNVSGIVTLGLSLMATVAMMQGLRPGNDPEAKPEAPGAAAVANGHKKQM